MTPAPERARDSVLRAAFVVDSDAWGGAEVYVRHLLQLAPAYGVEPLLVCAEPVAARFSGLLPAGSVRVVPLARHLQSAPQVFQALTDLGPGGPHPGRPDVVNVNLVDPASNVAALAAAQAVAPTVGTLHLSGDARQGPERERLVRCYAGLAAVLTPSQEGRTQLVEDLAVGTGRVHVVPNGVVVPPLAARPPDRRVPLVGGLGRLTAQKGFDVLLDAVRLLRARGVDLEVVVGGEGRDGAALRRQAEGLPVRFSGFVDDVPGFMAGLDLFVLPSRHEALPFALLEAMAAGRACVATDVGDVRAAVGDAAVVVPAQDAEALAGAIAPLLESAAERERLGRCAHRRALDRLDVHSMARRTFEVLRAAALSGAPPLPTPLSSPAPRRTA